MLCELMRDELDFMMFCVSFYEDRTSTYLSEPEKEEIENISDKISEYLEES